MGKRELENPTWHGFNTNWMVIERLFAFHLVSYMILRISNTNDEYCIGSLFITIIA